MQTFSTVVRELQENPRSFVDCRCAMLVGAFISGYKLVDASARPIWDAVAARFPGPSAADAAARAVLNFRTSDEAFGALVLNLAQLTRGRKGPDQNYLINYTYLNSLFYCVAARGLNS
jgi:hypothetical protein